MDLETSVIELAPDGTLKLPRAIRSELGNPQRLSVIRVGTSLVLAPIPERWSQKQGRVIRYQNGFIVRNPQVMFGTPVISGTRIPVQTIAGYIEAGFSPAQIQDEFPQLSTEQIQAVSEFMRSRRDKGK